MKMEYIFVYGSLMEGFYNYNKGMASRIESNKPAYIENSKLFHQSKKGYPAVVKGKSRVYGELLKIKDMEETLTLTDEIEGYKEGQPLDEYDRLIVDVIENETGIKRKAYMYLYVKGDLGSLGNPVVLIEDGNWRRYME